MGIEDEVLGTLNLLQMDLGVLECQTSRGLFSNSIFDPSVIGASVHCRPAHYAGLPLCSGIRVVLQYRISDISMLAHLKALNLPF